jgi:hypothetical protein
MSKAYPQRTQKYWLDYWIQRSAQNRPEDKQASARQTARVRAIANSKGVDDWEESRALFGCISGALCSGASRALADWMASDEFESAIR